MSKLFKLVLELPVYVFTFIATMLVTLIFTAVFLVVGALLGLIVFLCIPTVIYHKCLERKNAGKEKVDGIEVR